MPYNEIRAINRSCRSYRPGHQVHWIRAQVHWIRAKKSVEEEQPVIDVTVVVHDDGRVDIQADDLNLTAWNHDPQRLQSAVDYWGRAVWKPRYHALSLPGLFGYVFNLAPRHERTPCKPSALSASPPAATENAVDRLLRAAREDHGLTLWCRGPNRSIRSRCRSGKSMSGRTGRDRCCISVALPTSTCGVRAAPLGAGPSRRRLPVLHHARGGRRVLRACRTDTGMRVRRWPRRSAVPARTPRAGRVRRCR